MLLVCVGCSGGARPTLVTPSPTEVPATRPADLATPVPSPVSTRSRIPFPPATIAPLTTENETTTAATLPAQNETHDRGNPAWLESDLYGGNPAGLPHANPVSESCARL